MDIIAAHRQGLIEQLDAEVAELAGRGRDHGQRAVVLHHLHDHSRMAHDWALAEARRALRIAAGIAALRRRLDRWTWIIGDREQARIALESLAEALGQAGKARAMAAHRAYRLTATAALREEADAHLPAALLGALDECHAARRAGTDLAPDARQLLAALTEEFAAAAVDQDALDAAWAAADQTSLSRAARRLLGDEVLARAIARDERRGWAKVERQLRNDPALPVSFRANPAQHFYALQHMLRERRRQHMREACDREPDAFELAA
jgi:hypothetical protein